MFKKILAGSIILYCVNSYSALNAYSCASRANCINNETVAWDATQKWELITASKHCHEKDCNDMAGTFSETCVDTDLPGCHILKSKLEKTWRSASVDWGEGSSGGWTVIGSCHRNIAKPIDKYPQWELQSNIVKDCNLYDGWWEWEPPKESQSQNDVDKNKTIDLSKLPKEGDGIKIIPSNELPSQNDTHKIKNGYIESESNYPNYLLTLEEKQRKTWINPKEEYNPRSFYLKQSKDHVSLAFTFKGFNLPKSKIIGYTGGGVYIENKGWSSFYEYFSTDITACLLNVTDYKSARGGLIIAKESIDSMVNKKPSTTSISGSEKTGFLYSISWFDISNSIAYNLDCANLKYDKSIMDKVIDYANEIDKQQN